jgi:hypothetical protein
MDALEDARSVLRTAEQKLRVILVEAAEVGNYDQLPQIAEWAKLLNATLFGQSVAEPSKPPPQPLERAEALPVSATAAHEPLAVVNSRTPVLDAHRVKTGRRKKTRQSKNSSSGYPKFIREGDALIKIGWSKSQGKPYEHKAPRAVLRALVKELIRIGSGGARFTVEGIFPLKDTGKTDIPDYQAYLTLAWLRSVELITQHGRQGYSLPNGADLERQSEQKWNELSKR